MAFGGDGTEFGVLHVANAAVTPTGCELLYQAESREIQFCQIHESLGISCGEPMAKKSEADLTKGLPSPLCVVENSQRFQIR